MALFSRNTNKRNNKSAVMQFLATGGAAGQITVIEQVVANANLSEDEKIYFEAEVLPMAKILFLSAQAGRDRFFKFAELDNSANVGCAILAAFSAVPILADEQKFIPLLIIAVVGALQGGLRVTLARTQPEIDWLSARKAYDKLISLSVERLTNTGTYKGMDDDEKLQIFAFRISIVLDEVEKTIQGKIKTFIAMQTPDKCEPDKAKDSDGS